MPRQIALLRGVNLGPRRRVDMRALRELLAGAGFGDVRTYLQSGNVVLTSPAEPQRVAAELERLMRDALGVDARVVVRTRDELAAVVACDPLGHVAADPKRYQVTFLERELDPDRLRMLDALRAADEGLVVDGREIYAWHPAGAQASKLWRALADARLGVTATARNWNTVTKLLELADA